MAGYTIPTEVAFSEGDDTIDTNHTHRSPPRPSVTNLEIALPPPSDEEPDTIEIPSSAKRLIFSL